MTPETQPRKLGRALHGILERRRRVLLAFWALFLAMVPGLFELELDNSPEAFFVRDAVQLERYRALEESFGDFEVIRIATTGGELWSGRGLEWLETVERRAARLPGAMGAAGLWGHHRARYDRWPPADPAAFRELVLADTIDRNAGWVNAAGDTVTVLVLLADLGPDLRRRLRQGLDRLLAEAPPGFATRAAGLTLVQAALDEAFFQGGVWVVAPLLLLSAALLAWLLRSAVGVVLPIAMIAFCQVVVFGAIGYSAEALGTGLNVVSMVIAPLLLVLTLAMTLHVQLRFRQHLQRGLTPEEAVVRTYRDKGWSLFWAGVTTGVGFGSLLLSSMPPVRATGGWLALGIGVMTVALFTLFPALLHEFRAPAKATRTRPFERFAGRWGRALAAAAVRRRGSVLAALGLTSVVALAGVLRLEVDSSVVSYFRAGHPVRRDLEELESRGLAVTSADLVLDVSAAGAGKAERPDVRTPSERRRLGELAARLRAEPLIFGALSAAELSAAEPDPGDSRAADAVFLATGRALLESRDGSQARVRLLTPMLGIRPMAELFERIESTARDAFPESEVRLTGRYPLVLEAQRTLLGTLATSLSLTVLCIAAVFRWALGSTRLALLALVPNLWPVAGVLGVMGWLGVPLEGPTVMIAAVALGLAVDDTLHFVGELRGLAATGSAAEAAVLTEERIAGAQLLTSLVLAAGFGACALSAFIPVARFAALMVVAVALALAGDLLVMPALFARLRREALDRLR